MLTAATKRSDATARLIALHAGLSLFVGSLVYLGLRVEPVFFVDSLELESLRQKVFSSPLLSTLRAHTPDWVVYNLPDGLWAYSFMIAFGASLGLQNHPFSVVATIPFLGGAAYEVAQAFDLVPGTFDPLDLLYIALGSYGGWRVLKRHRSKNSASVA